MTTATMTTDDASSGPLGRYMVELELVAAFPGALTLGDVASMLGLPKTTAHRLLKGLVKAGLAREAVGGRAYDLGERLTRLVHAASLRPPRAWMRRSAPCSTCAVIGAIDGGDAR